MLMVALVAAPLVVLDLGQKVGEPVYGHPRSLGYACDRSTNSIPYCTASASATAGLYRPAERCSLDVEEQRQ